MRHILLTLCLALGLIAAPAFGSVTLELSNGTKLVGEIVKEEQGKITFRADLIGEVVIDAASVVKRTETPGAPAPAAAAPSAPAPAAVESPVVMTKSTPPTTAGALPVDPTAAAAASSARVFWKRILSINGSYTSAAYNQGPMKGAAAGFPTGAQVGLQGAQSMLQVSGTLIGATPYQAFTLTGSYGYARYEPAGTVMNNHSLEATYTYVLSPKDYWLTRSTYKVDKPAYIQHDFEQVVGFGHKFIDTSRTKLDLIPGLSLVQDTRGTVWDGKWILSGGFLEHFEHAINERVSLEQRFKYRVGLQHTSVWAIDSYLGFKVGLSEHWSLNLGGTYTYDNTLGPLPPPLVNAFVAQGIPLAAIQQLRPAEKGQFLTKTGIEYNW
jgi:Protein of unknown function, DUF481